jgi:hypothetical protein
MKGTEQRSGGEDRNSLAGDVLFLGGVILVFSILLPGFGVPGLVIGGSFVLSGCWLGWHARRRAQVAVRVSARVNT